ncbi:hypothetical protein M404DRAFT_527415 [Pisolithus tinctorius Marx 270]|uniref:Uncharacterized protein n=1 Tax=Pisolithus tinctorius Marx 270 TaxID=870435 RepID=A0A0C3PCJ4_PISTI|nr:hypothetical protein M404DRAFT_527415 [Pisolithus tinctorius Marx 270]
MFLASYLVLRAIDYPVLSGIPKYQSQYRSKFHVLDMRTALVTTVIGAVTKFNSAADMVLAAGVTCSQTATRSNALTAPTLTEMLNNDGYGTPYSSPVKTRKLDRMPEITGIDDDEDDDDDDYYSLDYDGVSEVSEASDVNATQTFVDQEKQEMERRRVLEAVGVIVSNLRDHNRSMSHPRHANWHGVGVDATGLGGPEGERGFSIGAAKRHGSLPPAHEPLVLCEA